MTKEYIEEAYEKLKNKLGRQPGQTEFFGNTTVTSHFLLRAGFRTYSALVEKMGDTPKAFFHSGITEEEYLISYGNMVRQLNHIPSTADWTFYKGKPAMSNYKIKFNVNSWSHIAEKFYDFAREKKEWQDILSLVSKTNNNLPVIQKQTSDECYVYFMLDAQNGFYKIGISNEPEWREKTLQSQKPSIKKIAAKRFVNRRIAANIEKALHDSYSHKRKRGEWFQLDQEDIDEITETLK